MTAKNSLLDTPPFEVASNLAALGRNLRAARLNRNLTIEQVAEKIGVHRHVITAAERGKPSTGIGIYAGLLWAYGMVDQLGDVASPERDAEGRLLSQANAPVRGGRATKRELDNDF